MATTEQLIRKTQRGSRHAREELYHRYALRVVFLVRVRMGPVLRMKEQSGDLAQEALLKSLSGLDNLFFRDEGAFIGYLAKKVEEVLCDRTDYWQAAKRNPVQERPLTGDGISHSILQLSPRRMLDESTPPQVLERSEELERLARALDRLRQENEEYWQLVLSIDLESRAIVDIALEQQRTPGAVRKQHTRAKEALARIFLTLDGRCWRKMPKETIQV